MSADAAVLFFGVRFPVESETELERLESRKDERLAVSRTAKLHTWFGRITDGQPYFLLIGHRLGIMGVENDTDLAWSQTELEQVLLDTKNKLLRAGFRADDARLHCIFHGDH